MPLSLYWRELTAKGTIAGMITGTLVVSIWDNISGGPGGISDPYEIFPDSLLSLLVAILVSQASHRPNAEIQEETD